MVIYSLFYHYPIFMGMIWSKEKIILKIEAYTKVQTKFLNNINVIEIPLNMKYFFFHILK